MRTAVDLDEDILAVAEHLAQEREQSLGCVLSDLARRDLQSSPAFMSGHNGIPTLPQKPGARSVTTKHVRDLLNELDLEDSQPMFQKGLGNE